MSNPNPSPGTRFKSKGSAALTKLVALKLSRDMELSVRQVAGDNFSAWIREAIAEKLEKEKRISA